MLHRMALEYPSAILWQGRAISEKVVSLHGEKKQAFYVLQRWYQSK